MNKFRLIAPVWAVLALLLATSPSHATFNIYLQEAGVNGGAITQVGTGADFTSASFTGTYGDFTVKVYGGASDNDATLSDLLSSTTSLTNNAGSTQTLNLYVSQTNYTLPAGTPLVVESSLGGSVTTGTLDYTNIFQAYADKNNVLLGMSDYTNGPQTATPTGSSFDTGSATGLFDRTAGEPYSLTSMVTFTLSGGGKANFSDHVNVTATPAPAALVLVASGVPALALAFLRRRKVKVQQS